jgi:hypothetical protein
VFHNFEHGNTFADLSWTATGDFVGKGPVSGSLPGQEPVTGFLGSKLVNTFFNGDSSVGTIKSPIFTVNNKKYINVLVGGGNHPHDPNASDAPPRQVLCCSRAPTSSLRFQALQPMKSSVGLQPAAWSARKWPRVR